MPFKYDKKNVFTQQNKVFARRVHFIWYFIPLFGSTLCFSKNDNDWHTWSTTDQFPISGQSNQKQTVLNIWQSKEIGNQHHNEQGLLRKWIIPILNKAISYCIVWASCAFLYCVKASISFSSDYKFSRCCTKMSRVHTHHGFDNFLHIPQWSCLGLMIWCFRNKPNFLGDNIDELKRNIKCLGLVVVGIDFNFLVAIINKLLSQKTKVRVVKNGFMTKAGSKSLLNCWATKEV